MQDTFHLNKGFQKHADEDHWTYRMVVPWTLWVPGGLLGGPPPAGLWCETSWEGEEGMHTAHLRTVGGTGLSGTSSFDPLKSPAGPQHLA